MKKIGLLIGILMILGGMIAVEAVIPDSVDLKVSLISQDPDPVNPGEYVDVRWKVINDGSADAEDVVFEILPTYPFSLDPGQSAIQDIGSVWGLQQGERGIILHYKLRVAEDAVEGGNEIELKANVKGVSQIFNFTINVQTIDAAVGVTSVLTEPETIVPGDESKIKIILKNLADSLMEDISLKLDLSSDDLPLAPIGGTTEKRVRSLKPNSEIEVAFDVMALADAESQVYKIPLTLTYYDELENKYNKSDLIGVVVGAAPDMIVQVDETDILKVKSTGDVTIKIVNRGLSDIKFFTIELDSSDDYDVLSSDEVYIGDIDSDDYETADFTLYVKDASDKKVTLPIIAKYMDANNNRYTDKYDLIIDLDKVAKSNGSGSAFGSIVVIIVLAGLGYWFYRYRKKKRKR